MSENKIIKPARLSADETSLFCEQTAMILRSGIPLAEGMQTICKGYEKGRYNERFKELNSELLSGSSLGDAAKKSELFPEYVEQMTVIGEGSGRLDSVMDSLAKFYKHESEISAAAKSAVLYPSVLISLLTAVIVILVVGVLPVFRNIYLSLGIDPNSTMSKVTIIGWVLLGLLALAVVAAVVIVLLFKTNRDSVLKFLCHVFPPVKKAMADISAARFSSVMSVMLSSGKNIAEAVEAACRVASNTQGLFEKSFSDVSAGGFAAAMRSSGAFDELHCRIAEVGESVGSLDTVMARLGEIYGERAENSLSYLIALIEPTLIAALSIVVGGIMLSVLLPLLNVLTSIGM